MLTVKIEQMYPEREIIGWLKFDERNRSMQDMTEFVEQYIMRNMWSFRERMPEMVELRWEYEEYGQGHYIRLHAGEYKKPSVWVGKLNYNQMIDVLNEAVKRNDWRMVEFASYQLRQNQDMYNMPLSWAEFEVPFDYDFDWLYDDNQCLMTNEEFIAEEERLAGKIEEVTDDDPTTWDMYHDEVLETDDEYDNLRVAVQSGQVRFESNGQEITNPFYDETLRDPVDPIVYYGYNVLKKWL